MRVIQDQGIHRTAELAGQGDGALSAQGEIRGGQYVVGERFGGGGLIRSAARAGWEGEHGDKRNWISMGRGLEGPLSWR